MKKEDLLEELSKKKLEDLLAIMEKNSIQYSIDSNTYEIRLIPEIQQACKQIKALIKKEVTEEWIEEKAREAHDTFLAVPDNCDYKCTAMRIIKDFIRKIVEEIKK